MSFQELINQTKEDLVNRIYNQELSSVFLYGRLCPGDMLERYDQNIPYMDPSIYPLDFARKQIVIADFKEYIAILAVGAYHIDRFPNRLMTEGEVDTFISYLDQILYRLNKGENAREKCVEMWDWLKSLQIGEKP